MKEFLQKRVCDPHFEEGVRISGRQSDRTSRKVINFINTNNRKIDRGEGVSLYLRWTQPLRNWGTNLVTKRAPHIESLSRKLTSCYETYIIRDAKHFYKRLIISLKFFRGSSKYIE